MSQHSVEELKFMSKHVLLASDVSADQYDALRSYLRERLIEADLGELDPTPVLSALLSGVRSSKFMSLTANDRERLLSGEKFEVYDNDGHVSTKSFGEMDTLEKNRLLGPKGGYLHKLSEQQWSGSPSRMLTKIRVTDDTISYTINGQRFTHDMTAEEKAAVNPSPVTSQETRHRQANEIIRLGEVATSKTESNLDAVLNMGDYARLAVDVAFYGYVEALARASELMKAKVEYVRRTSPWLVKSLIN